MYFTIAVIGGTLWSLQMQLRDKKKLSMEFLTG